MSQGSTRDPTSQGSPRLLTQFKDGSRLAFSWPFSYLSFSSFTFPGAPYRIFLMFLLWLPCHIYLVSSNYNIGCISLPDLTKLTSTSLNSRESLTREKLIWSKFSNYDEKSRCQKWRHGQTSRFWTVWNLYNDDKIKMARKPGGKRREG